MPIAAYKNRRKTLCQSVKRHDQWLEDMEKYQAEAQKHRAEADRLREENEKNWKRFTEENDKGWQRLREDFGRLGISYGEQVESMFVNLWSKFVLLGYHFEKDGNNAKFIDSKNKKILAEVDRLLENGDVVMPVEIKAKLKKDDVDCHINRLKIISKYMSERNDSRVVHGAVAGGTVPDNVLAYALNKGLYVLIQNGNSISLAALPENFEPRVW